MHASHEDSAEAARSLIVGGRSEPRLFREALLGVPAADRDAWVDAVFGLGELPPDGPELPAGGVPYMPCAVDALLRVVDRAPVRATDVFVDVGSGVGRAAALVHLLTGASVVGLEVQPPLVLAARDLMRRLRISRVALLEGDAATRIGEAVDGSVYFLYCPFSGERLVTVLGELERVARGRTLRVCAVDLPLPPCPWLTLQESVPPGDLAIHRSRALR